MGQSLRRVLDVGGLWGIAATICEYELANSDISPLMCSVFDSQSKALKRTDLEKSAGAFREFVSSKSKSLHRRRLCMFVDRRCSDYEQPQHRFSDVVTFYAPPEGADEVRVSQDRLVG